MRPLDDHRVPDPVRVAEPVEYRGQQLELLRTPVARRGAGGQDDGGDQWTETLACRISISRVGCSVFGSPYRPIS
jgi:hypothetical protein